MTLSLPPMLPNAFDQVRHFYLRLFVQRDDGDAVGVVEQDATATDFGVERLGASDGFTHVFRDSATLPNSGLARLAAACVGRWLPRACHGHLPVAGEPTMIGTLSVGVVDVDLKPDGTGTLRCSHALDGAYTLEVDDGRIVEITTADDLEGAGIGIISMAGAPVTTHRFTWKPKF